MTSEERIAIARLFNDLRIGHGGAMGVIGIIEMRKLLANLFPEFQEVQDVELEERLSDWVTSLSNPESLEDKL